MFLLVFHKCRKKTYKSYYFQVSGDGSNRQREKMQKHREPVRAADPGQPCKLTFKMSGAT